jgi:hypothetical protein
MNDPVGTESSSQSDNWNGGDGGDGDSYEQVEALMYEQIERGNLDINLVADTEASVRNKMLLAGQLFHSFFEVVPSRARAMSQSGKFGHVAPMRGTAILDHKLVRALWLDSCHKDGITDAQRRDACLFVSTFFQRVQFMDFQWGQCGPYYIITAKKFLTLWLICRVDGLLCGTTSTHVKLRDTIMEAYYVHATMSELSSQKFGGVTQVHFLEMMTNLDMRAADIDDLTSNVMFLRRSTDNDFGDKLSEQQLWCMCRLALQTPGVYVQLPPSGSLGGWCRLPPRSNRCTSAHCIPF